METTPEPVIVTVENAPADEQADICLHPKNPDAGTKKIWRGKKLLVDQVGLNCEVFMVVDYFIL